MEERKRKREENRHMKLETQILKKQKLLKRWHQLINLIYDLNSGSQINSDTLRLKLTVSFLSTKLKTKKKMYLNRRP